MKSSDLRGRPSLINGEHRRSKPKKRDGKAAAVGGLFRSICVGEALICRTFDGMDCAGHQPENTTATKAQCRRPLLRKVASAKAQLPQSAESRPGGAWTAFEARSEVGVNPTRAPAMAKSNKGSKSGEPPKRETLGRLDRTNIREHDRLTFRRGTP
jgi:hypothetical protein